MTRLLSVEYQGLAHTLVETLQGSVDITAICDAPTIDEFLRIGRLSPKVVSHFVAAARDKEREKGPQMLPLDPRNLPPVSRPSKILCVGRNYAAHAKELGNAVPAEPVFFAKTPNCLVPHMGPIVIPPGVGRVEHEVELAVVIGKRAARLSPEEALGVVAGYTILNDVTARELQKGLAAQGLPWTAGKCIDSFAPCGPYLVLPDEFDPLEDHAIELHVNGELRQQGRTSQMIHSVPQLLAALTRTITLEPGDIVATGTPAGVGPLVPGDVVVASIEGLGSLENLVIGEDQVVGGARASAASS
jgi:2-keto-4-pentenoate hydratase/2-oxohepta-3-ene-1,7-dioic acid hydratase in catechol pathway